MHHTLFNARDGVVLHFDRDGSPIQGFIRYGFHRSVTKSPMIGLAPPNSSV
jgi:hypothetical protein